MSQIRGLFRQYGKVAVGVHLTVYAASFAGLYMAAKNQMNVESLLVKYGLLSERGADSPPEGWLQKTLAGGGSAVVIAFVCNKALLPVRVPITVGLTPMVARVLQQRVVNKGSRSGTAKSGRD